MSKLPILVLATALLIPVMASAHWERPNVQVSSHVLDEAGIPDYLPLDPPPAQAPVCVQDPLTEHHGLLIYARPKDGIDRYAEMAPKIRENFLLANGVLFSEAARFGVEARFRMRCLDGVSEVANVVLPTTTVALDTPVFVVQDLMFRSPFKSSMAKYWVWYDDVMICSCLGVGTIPENDDSPGVTNLNNVGPDYGVSHNHPLNLLYGYIVMLHENVHNLGFIQLTAPDATLDYHCTDGPDVMCHFDTASPSADCGADTLDCHNDDYFNPAPQPGDYLATHWNLGSGANRFIQFGP